MKKENKIYLFVVFMFVLSLFLFSFTIYLKHIAILERVEIVTKLRVGGIPAFDVDTDVLAFGTIALGTSSRRTLTIQNDYDFPIKAEFSVEGDIEEFLVFDKIIFLDIGESKDVNVNTIILAEGKQGNYSGRFITTIKKSWKDI
ncbi:hypothetical protein KAT80_02485 [Candidatus Pacearchaeota archaeon]|nr:hypothetical protein [Candidatus Pacearchaeota archaeon]